jgi:hypothetical protein
MAPLWGEKGVDPFKSYPGLKGLVGTDVVRI